MVLGNPSTFVRVLPSTAASAIFAVNPVGCSPSNVTASNCNTTRAGIWNRATSTSAKPIGGYALGLEANLGFKNSNGTYVYDTAGLGFSNTTTQATLDSQVIATYSSNQYYIGMFGLNHQPTNFSTLEDSHPAPLTVLNASQQIPSLSWGYTAGARYRSESAFGSLTLGGYDASKFVPNNISFPLATDISRDIVVPINSITSKNSTGYTSSLLPTPISAYIDSTVPYLYLPEAACKLFEQTLGLVYNETVKQYWVDDALHQSLLANNTNITLHLGASGGATVDIEMPYASFDLQGSFPFFPSDTNITRYFPLRKADNDTQYTLGRTFLQEAYLITNYEYSNFSVSQRIFDDNAAKQIVPILSANETAALAAATPQPVNWRLAVGLGVPFGIIFACLVAFLVFFFIRRRRQIPRAVDRTSSRLLMPAINVELPADLPLAEAVPHKMFGYHEMDDTGKMEAGGAKYATFGYHEMADTGLRAEMATERSRKPSVIEVTSTIEVERSESFAPPPSVATPTPSERPSSESYMVSPVTPLEQRRRKDQVFTSSHKPPRIGTSSNRSGPSEQSPVSSPTSGHLSLDKSLPPTPVSSESNRSSHVRPMSEVSPGLGFAAGVILPPSRYNIDDNDDIRSQSFTPVSDISDGPRVATRVALPPWRTLPTTPVSPASIVPQTPDSSRSFQTARSPGEPSPGLQIISRVAVPPWRYREDRDMNHDEGRPETVAWDVLNDSEADVRSSRTDARW